MNQNQKKNKALKHQLKRARSEEKRKQKSEYSPILHKKQLLARKIDDRIIENHSFPLMTLLKKNHFFSNTQFNTEFKIPKEFSISKDFTANMRLISSIIYSVFTNSDISIKIKLNFYNCTYTDFPTLFFLKILLTELKNNLNSINKRLSILEYGINIEIIDSKSSGVNRKLFGLGLIKDLKMPKNELQPKSKFDFEVGHKQKKHYAENQKAKIATGIREYLNECLSNHGVVLNVRGNNRLDGIITEILNNAEDHSTTNKWYISANYYQDEEKEFTGEFNLCFMNLGDSIYEGFEKTKKLNSETYSKVNEFYEYMQKKTGKTFSRESLFTLYILQDNISRLIYERESGGTGTMKFINSFYELGNYVNQERGYHPVLSIHSGNTRILCDNTVKPIKDGNSYYIALNQESNMSNPPSQKNLFSLNTTFPGTLLFAKMFINRSFLIRSE